jgi:hypothetical protein
MARKSYPNLPMTPTAFKKEIAALNSAIWEMFGSDVFHHAEFAYRDSPDDREDRHNVLREQLDPAYHAQCDLFDKYKADAENMKDLDMHGPVILDLYVYENIGYGDYDLLTNVYAYFKNGKLIGVAEFDSPNNASLLEAVQRP